MGKIDENLNFENRNEDKILCVGRLVVQKNYLFLIDSMSDIKKKNIQIDIFGKDL